MPLYPLKCENCGHTFEKLFKSYEAYKACESLECPECGCKNVNMGVGNSNFKLVGVWS